MKTRKRGLAACASGALILSLGWVAVAGAYPQAAQAGQRLPDLTAGLKKIEGCLGVETARTSSGKQVIFAWFENKQAAARWYWSEMHQGIMASAFPDHEPSEPMASVPENVGPILAIASITFSDEHELDQVALPISQIAIELYTPINGGIALGGRFAPEKLRVPKRKIIVDEG